MRRALLLACLLGGGCFDWVSLSSGPVAHLDVDDAFAGTAELVLAEDYALDTTALSISPPLPGVDLRAAAQPTAGGASAPELAVLRVARLTLLTGVTLRVSGTRPLLVLAGDAVLLDGVVDVSAKGITPGAGGGGPSEGSGAGKDGARVDTDSHRNTGGAGGSFGEVGGAGGSADDMTRIVLVGPAGAPAYGDTALTVLQGGSGGGAGGPDVCARKPGGAGGGAIQITAAHTLRIGVTGGIDAGGGGGPSGISEADDGTCRWGGAGSGGGSGGAILLQASSVEVQGRVSANGGGGGAGTSGTQKPGMPGMDGALGTQPAPGGVPASDGLKGGDGGYALGAAAPGEGGDVAGGGGGAVGRIRVACDNAPTIASFSPRASIVAWRAQ